MANTSATNDKKFQGNEGFPLELITKKEAAQRLRISERKIELDKGFPNIRWGRSVRYSWPQIMAYLQKGGAA